MHENRNPPPQIGGGFPREIQEEILNPLLYMNII